MTPKLLIGYLLFLRWVRANAPADYERRRRQVWELVAEQYADAGGSRVPQPDVNYPCDCDCLDCGPEWDMTTRN